MPRKRKRKNNSLHKNKFSVTLANLLTSETKSLTLREIRVRTNRTAATTRYLSLLRVKNKTLSITLLRRKLHLKIRGNTRIHISLSTAACETTIVNDHISRTKDCTLFYTDGAKHKSKAVQKCLIVFQALQGFDFQSFHCSPQVCWLIDQCC